MRSAHRYICAGLAALTLGTALTGCSGISLLNGISEQTEGELGDTMSNMFFDFTVNSAGTVDSYDGYTPSDGNQLILCNITLKNTFGEALPMYDSDFQLQWGDGDEDYAWPPTTRCRWSGPWTTAPWKPTTCCLKFPPM